MNLSAWFISNRRNLVGKNTTSGRPESDTVEVPRRETSYSSLLTKPVPLGSKSLKAARMVSSGSVPEREKEDPVHHRPARPTEESPSMLLLLPLSFSPNRVRNTVKLMGPFPSFSISSSSSSFTFSFPARCTHTHTHRPSSPRRPSARRHPGATNTQLPVGFPQVLLFDHAVPVLVDAAKSLQRKAQNATVKMIFGT